MALFKNRERVRPSSSLAFDRAFRPGNDAAYEGIYICLNCGMEIVAKGGLPLPNVKQREHPTWCSGVQWQLLVSTSADSK